MARSRHTEPSGPGTQRSGAGNQRLAEENHKDAKRLPHAVAGLTLTHPRRVSAERPPTECNGQPLKGRHGTAVTRSRHGLPYGGSRLSGYGGRSRANVRCDWRRGCAWPSGV